jgi:hypothetical protein
MGKLGFLFDVTGPSPGIASNGLKALAQRYGADFVEIGGDESQRFCLVCFHSEEARDLFGAERTLAEFGEMYDLKRHDWRGGGV